MQKYSQQAFIIKNIVFICLLIVLTQCTPFYPIQAGTFYITSEDLLGLDKVTTKQIIIQTPWQVFKQNFNIDIVCAISSINIDQRVSFQFNYSLVDRYINEKSDKLIMKKVIEVVITDKKGFDYPQFQIGVDFLIAQSIRVGFYNITQYQQHLMNKSITQQQKNPSNKQVHNQLFIFPNGFSSVNLTHNIMYGFSYDNDMYTIHYMKGTGLEHIQQGWKQGSDFVFFRYVLYPRYPYGYKQCGIVYQSMLTGDFYFSCDKKGIDSYFYGFMGYSGHQLRGKFYSSRTGFGFDVKHIDENSKYNVIGFPFKISPKFNFIDNRQRSYLYIQQKQFFIYLVIAVTIIIMAIVTWVIIKKKKLVYFDLQQQKVLTTQQSIPKTNNSSKSKSQLKRKNNRTGDNHGQPHEKTSDQSMKQQDDKKHFQRKQENMDDAVSQNFDIQ